MQERRGVNGSLKPEQKKTKNWNKIGSITDSYFVVFFLFFFS